MKFLCKKSDTDRLSADDFLGLVVEVLHIAVIERLSGRVPEVGVEAKQVFEEVERVLRSSGKHGGECLFLGDVGAGDDVRGEW